MTDAYHASSALEAEAALLALANELDRTHPGAAASLREGLDETLTVLRLGVPPTLARTLRSTNTIGSMISISRDHARNVKGWRDGQMALRWCAAGMVEAGKQFRRVNGHLHLPALRTALERESAQSVGSVVDNDQAQPDAHRAAIEVPRDSGHPLSLLRNKFCRTTLRGGRSRHWGFAVVQDNDAGVPQVARGVFLTSRSSCM